MRRCEMAVRGGAAAAAAMCMMLACPAHAQSPGTTLPQMPDVSGSHSSPLDDKTPDPVRERVDAERLKALNDDRHKRLVADAQKLLDLATELKADVDKANKNELSVTVVKKAAEMEKLAHDVKERMRD